mgnify:CR=1 FL=1
MTWLHLGRQGGAETASRRRQGAPRHLSISATGTAQDRPKLPQDTLRPPPKLPKAAPRWPQDPLKSPSRRPQEPPKKSEKKLNFFVLIKIIFFANLHELTILGQKKTFEIFEKIFLCFFTSALYIHPL